MRCVTSILHDGVAVLMDALSEDRQRVYRLISEHKRLTVPEANKALSIWPYFTDEINSCGSKAAGYDFVLHRRDSRLGELKRNVQVRSPITGWPSTSPTICPMQVMAPHLRVDGSA